MAVVHHGGHHTPRLEDGSTPKPKTGRSVPLLSRPLACLTSGFTPSLQSLIHRSRCVIAPHGRKPAIRKVPLANPQVSDLPASRRLELPQVSMGAFSRFIDTRQRFILP